MRGRYVLTHAHVLCRQVQRSADETDRQNMMDDSCVARRVPAHSVPYSRRCPPPPSTPTCSTPRFPPLAVDDVRVRGDWHTGEGTAHLEKEQDDSGWEFRRDLFLDQQPGRTGGNARLPPRVGGRTQALLLFKAEKEGLIRVKVRARLQCVSAV